MNGAYQYFLNGALTDITEAWTIETQANGLRRIVSDRQAPKSGAHIRVEACESNGHLTHFQVDWANTSERAVKIAHARYWIELGQARVAREVAGQARHETHALTSPVFPSPLLRIFTGRVIRRLAQCRQPATVLVPWILDPTNADLLLSAKLEPRSARRLCVESITVGERLYQAEKYEYIGGHYDDTAEFWLDERDVLLRYCWTQSEALRWEVVVNEEG